MNTLSFDAVAKSAIEGSPILSDEMVAQYLLNNLTNQLHAYLYRVAAHAVDGLRRAEGCWRDEEDYIDALQECCLHFPQILRTRNAQSKLSTYSWATFKRTAARYLAYHERGGMAGDERNFDDIPVPVSVETLLPPEDGEGNETEETWLDSTGYNHTPQGLRDPMEEVMASETVSEALSTLRTREPTKGNANRLRAEMGGKENLL